MGTLMASGLFSGEGRTAELLRVSPRVLEGNWNSGLQELLAPMDEVEPLLISLKDLPPLVLSGRIQLWVANDKMGFFCAAITEIVQYPRAVVCRIFWLGGKRAEDCLFMFEHLEHWAKKHNVRYMEAVGRFGWERVADKVGYERKGSRFIKDLANGHDLGEH